MGPRPRESNYFIPEDYEDALRRWTETRDRLEAERLRMMPNIASVSDTIEATFSTAVGNGDPFYSSAPMGAQPTPRRTYSDFVAQARRFHGSLEDEEKPEEKEEEIDVSQESIDKLMKTRHLTKSERQALHKPKSDWIEGKKGEECRAACELKVDDLVPETLRVKKVVKQR